MKNLALNQMEMTYGGVTDLLTNKNACNEFALGVGGAGVIIGVVSWWTGVGAGVAALAGLGGFVISAYCDSI